MKKFENDKCVTIFYNYTTIKNFISFARRNEVKKFINVGIFTLTFIPISVVSLLLYKSGCYLSKASYRRNLAESINVQADYISQTIENIRILDSRFVNRNLAENL